MDNPECEKLIRGYVDCYNDFDIAGMLEFLSDSVVFENESGGEVNARAEGKAEFKELAEQAAKLFSFSTDNHSLSRNQVYEHCIQMAQMYERQGPMLAVTIGRSDTP